MEGLIRLMGTPDEVGGPVNLGNPVEVTMRELAHRILALTGSRSDIIHRPLPADDPVRRCPDISLAHALLDWTPTVSLDDGLARTIDYFADGTSSHRLVPHTGQRPPRSVQRAL